MFKWLLNLLLSGNRGEATVTAEDPVDENGLEGTPAENPQEEPQKESGDREEQEEVPEEEKLYAGRFKTPEELEEHYKLSSQEGIRLAQRVRQLEAQLQTVNTPAEKVTVKEEIVDLKEHFEPKTAEILEKYFTNLVSSKLTETQSAILQQQKFQETVDRIWEETKKAYKNYDISNPQSPLYSRANNILFERGLASLGQDGKVVLNTPYAYRLAVDAAFAELKDSLIPVDKVNKSRVTSVAGRGSKPIGQAKLTAEQYLSLNEEQKDEYDKAQLQR